MRACASCLGLAAAGKTLHGHLPPALAHCPGLLGMVAQPADCRRQSLRVFRRAVQSPVLPLRAGGALLQPRSAPPGARTPRRRTAWRAARLRTARLCAAGQGLHPPPRGRRASARSALRARSVNSAVHILLPARAGRLCAGPLRPAGRISLDRLAARGRRPGRSPNPGLPRGCRRRVPRTALPIRTRP